MPKNVYLAIEKEAQMLSEIATKEQIYPMQRQLRLKSAFVAKFNIKNQGERIYR